MTLVLIEICFTTCLINAIAVLSTSQSSFPRGRNGRVGSLPSRSALTDRPHLPPSFPRRRNDWVGNLIYSKLPRNKKPASTAWYGLNI